MDSLEYYFLLNVYRKILNYFFSILRNILSKLGRCLTRNKFFLCIR